MDTSFRTLPTTIHFNPEDNVQIANAELVDGDFSMVIDILNLSDEYIKAVEFAVKFKGQDKSYLFNGEEFLFKRNISVSPHSRYYLEPIPLDERFTKARAIDLYISSYQTEKKQIVLNSHKFETKLPVIPEKKRKSIKHNLGGEIKTYGENHIHYWRCVCGAINLKDEENCRFCNRNKSFVLNNLTEPMINQKILNIMETTNFSTMTEDERINEIKTHLTKTNLSKVAPSTDSIKSDRTNLNEMIKMPKFFGKKLVLTITGIIIVIILALFVENSATKVRTEKSIEKANALIVEGEYDKALKIYKSIDESSTSNFGIEIDALVKLVNSNDHFEKGTKLLDKDKYINAAYNFKKVVPEDKKNFDKAQENLSRIEDIIINNAEALSKNSEKEDAINSLNSYLDVVDDSARAMNLKKEIEYNKNLIEDEKLKEEFEKNSQKIDPADMAKRAKNLIHNYKKVITQKANLRVDPDVNSDVIRVLEKNTEVYVKETKIEGSERVWCNVEAKDIETGEILKGWISDKTLN
ncbi:SH3 domain-containing protein [Peptoniphilus sp.]|jgi:tetratricopeptide (TPR) repeat protein|uniref:SH3 domain-containing protein n=1 Tax=Peptoniphilus sp. TaxID=1971214 RepID=UPI003D8D41A0